MLLVDTTECWQNCTFTGFPTSVIHSVSLSPRIYIVFTMFWRSVTHFPNFTMLKHLHFLKVILILYVSIIVDTAEVWLKLDGTLQSLSHFEISTEAWRRAPFPLQGIIIHWPNISNSVNHLTQFMYIQYVNNLTQLITIYNLRERTNGNVFSWQLICRWTIFYTLYKRRWQL